MSRLRGPFWDTVEEALRRAVSDSPALTEGWSFRAYAEAFTNADMKPNLVLCFFRKPSL